MVGFKSPGKAAIGSLNTLKKTGRVTIAGKPFDDIDKGTLNSILKQAKLKEVQYG